MLLYIFQVLLINSKQPHLEKAKWGGIAYDAMLP